MAGFPREEQLLLSQIVGMHRRKPVRDRLSELVPPWDERAIPLIVLLRIAVLLNRGRSAQPLPEIDLAAKRGALDIKFPSGWLDMHPLTDADLQQEVELVKSLDFRLRVMPSR
jgi:exopolyphosphatase/guanosine-5'-triphosphate,3'-diphosphate pyrophosphatase